MSKLLTAFMIFSLLNLSLIAQERPEAASAESKPAKAKDDEAAEAKKKKDEKDKKPPPPIITHHELNIGGKVIKYTASAGYEELMDYEGKPKANVFCVSYVRDAESGQTVDWSKRPITYAFNGGPGSSSVWLHLGALGPRRVDFVDENEKAGEPARPKPPYKVVDNEFAWLEFTDLLFIDPVSTGYSRAVEGEAARQFHGLDEDIRAVGEIIRLWTTRNRRWPSPKFLTGESYGTTRAAGLSGYLQGNCGMDLSGIVLISPVLNFQTLEFDTGNELPYWLHLPTYTATAWYHGKLDAELQKDLDKTLKEVEAFAAGEYQSALALGDELPQADAERIAEKLARYIGVSKTFVRQARLRIADGPFYKELLRDQGRTVGRLDSRYKGIDRNDLGDSPEYDPSYAATQGAFTAALNAYVRGELGYETDLPYEILSGRVHPWSFGSATNRYADVAGTLRQAMTTNPQLRVLVCSGYYDVATPYFAATYTMTHLGLDPALRANISQTFYEAGHMMYLRYADLKKLRADVGDFYGKALAR